MDSESALTTLFRHNRWANLRLLERCAELSDEQLDSSIVGVFGSIRDTLEHIVSAEASYLHRIRTGQPRPRSKGADEMSLSEMMESAKASGEGLIEWSARADPGERVDVTWDDGAIRQVPKAIFLTQAINHATEHRSQIMAILTQIGIEPPDLDGWTYFDESG